jgi:hypothetical protein
LSVDVFVTIVDIWVNSVITVPWMLTQYIALMILCIIEISGDIVGHIRGIKNDALGDSIKLLKHVNDNIINGLFRFEFYLLVLTFSVFVFVYFVSTSIWFGVEGLFKFCEM